MPPAAARFHTLGPTFLCGVPQPADRTSPLSRGQASGHRNSEEARRFRVPERAGPGDYRAPRAAARPPQQAPSAIRAAEPVHAPPFCSLALVAAAGLQSLPGDTRGGEGYGGPRRPLPRSPLAPRGRSGGHLTDRQPLPWPRSAGGSSATSRSSRSGRAPPRLSIGRRREHWHRAGPGGARRS